MISIDSEPSLPVLILGVGNQYRGDDAAGLCAVRKIQAQNLPQARVVEACGEGATVMEQWQGADLVILIDAVWSGAPAGTIFRFEAAHLPLPAKFFHYSSHAFGVAEAIELARVLKLLPPRLIVCGIEGKAYDEGAPLSPEVEQAICVIEREIVELLLTHHPA